MPPEPEHRGLLSTPCDGALVVAFHMRSMGAVAWCLGAFASFCASGACYLTTSLDGFAAGPAAGPDAGAESSADATPDRDAAIPGVNASAAVASCEALKRASPATPDGFQTIDPDGAAGPIPPFAAWCDMTADDGGWMLVTPAMAAEETNVKATVTRDADARGGLVMRVYANSQGCSSMVPPTRHRFIIRDWPAWTRVRLKQTFAGRASCWHVWGGLEANRPLPSNLVPFDKNSDVIRDAVGMGGTSGDAFDGKPLRCDMAPTNFWENGGETLRSARVIVRRNDLTTPAGLSTGADCGDFAPGAASPLWWEYREIYVR